VSHDPPAERRAPPAILRQGAPAAVLAALPGARAVGGVVRDVLAGRPVQDVDIGAPLPPDAVAARLRAAGLKVFETGLAHGTVTAVLDRAPVEVTSLRRDVATDGRHAEVEWTTDWREDAARRDFTINAMSMGADGALWDYYGGREDLAAGRVRFVGDPATRLAEDYLRALRFFRFQARYGRGAPDPAALAAIRAAVPGLARLSAERVWMELKRLLAAPDPGAALALMRDTGVLQAVLPEGADLDALARLVAAGAPADPLLRFAALVGQDAADADLPQRLRWSAAEAGRYAAARQAGAVRDHPAGAALRRALAETPPETLADAAWVAAAWGLPGDWPALRARIEATERPVFPLKGRDAVGAGLPPGPRIGQVLEAVRGWWLERGCTDDAAACRARLAAVIAAEVPPAGHFDGPRKS
jgi:poly(A) polymerase/tRNA nucleotidyltransferase (CCA-adding enzyme)